MDGPAHYELCVERQLGPAIVVHFPEFTITLRDDGCTVLSAELPDQAALHGALTRIRDLGLNLISVTRHIQERSP